MSEPLRNSLRAGRPGKTIWTILTIASGAIRLPFWLLYFIPRFTRQNPNWTWKQAVQTRILKVWLKWCSQVEMLTPFDLEPNDEKDQWTLIDPAKSSYYTGITTQDSRIKPIKMGGTWYPSKPTRIDEDALVVLHFHGGAYAIGDGRIYDAGFATHTMIKHAEVQHVFCPQYRLASNPGGRFPAALQDAITSYSYLVNDLGINSNKIIVSGDSAGGNLTAALLRYLAEHGNDIKLGDPKCAWLWSPWVDPIDSIHNSQNVLQSPNEVSDYIHPGFGQWGATYLAPDPKSGIPINTRYITLLGNPFKTKTPCWISTGSAEVLFHDDVKFYEQLKAIDGNTVELSIEENAPHDIILVGKRTAFDKEAKAAARKAGAFLRSLTKAKL